MHGVEVQASHCASAEQGESLGAALFNHALQVVTVQANYAFASRH